MRTDGDMQGCSSQCYPHTSSLHNRLLQDLSPKHHTPNSLSFPSPGRAYVPWPVLQRGAKYIKSASFSDFCPSVQTSTHSRGWIRKWPTRGAAEQNTSSAVGSGKKAPWGRTSPPCGKGNSLSELWSHCSSAF